jgi:hypothetical protein
MKTDAHGQVITSDNTSLIQIVLASGSDSLASHSTATSVLASGQAIVDGPVAFPMLGGHARLTFTIRPLFSRVSASEGAAVLQGDGEPRIYFEGFNREDCVAMRSTMLGLAVTSGLSVCPLGYVLGVDSDSSAEGPGACRRCAPGTYSVNPLAKDPSSSSDAPSCVACPAGGDCALGGAQVRFAVGVWGVRNGVYVLESCPAGHRLINSTAGTSSGTFSNAAQQCAACLPGQYVLDPNRDACQDCPAGDHILL